MIIGEAEVTGEKRNLGMAQYPVYETWDEVCSDEVHGIGEVKGLELLNAQVKTNAMNTLRTAKTKGPSKSLLRSEAMNEILEEVSSAPDSYPNVIGNRVALEALITKRMTEIEARMTAVEEEEEVPA